MIEVNLIISLILALVVAWNTWEANKLKATIAPIVPVIQQIAPIVSTIAPIILTKKEDTPATPLQVADIVYKNIQN
jgi:hypothetical protein